MALITYNYNIDVIQPSGEKHYVNIIFFRPSSMTEAGIISTYFVSKYLKIKNINLN